MSNKDPKEAERVIHKYRQTISQNVKELIQSLRSRDNLTQTDLAQKLGINRSLICQYESGDRYPSMESIIKLALYSGQSIDSIIGVGEAKYKLNKGEEKVIKKLRMMPTGHELTVKKEPTADQDILDAFISVKQEVKI
jgi:transcriptional regulator with XRE-family HTH domain